MAIICTTMLVPFSDEIGVYADGTINEAYSMEWKSNANGWWIEDRSGWYPNNQYLWIDGVQYWFGADGYWG